MEVHQHTHSPKKRWTHYLWEFLMLFLAVFCGFLAENFREHQVDKEKGKQYILSFYEDLKRDTTTFARIIALDEKKSAGLSDLFHCYDTVLKNWRATSCLISIARNSRSNLSVTFSNGTVQQLKNAGGYRLLNTDDRDSIMSYDNLIQDYKGYESTIFQESQDIVRSTASMALDFPSNKFLSPVLAGPDSTHTEMSLLFSGEKALLNKYFNDLLRYRAVIIGQTNQIMSRKARADHLLAYFKNKFHLE